MITELDTISSGPLAVVSGAGSLLHYSKRAINLEFKSRVITLLPRGGVLAPSSVILNVDSLEMVRGAVMRGKRMITERFSAAIRNSVDLELREGKTNRAHVEQELRRHLRPIAKSMMNALLAIQGEKIERPASALEKAVLSDQVEAIRGSRDLDDLAARIIGKGFGLTPSGDDFLVGAIAIVDLLGGDASRLRTIFESYENALSRTMLLDAVDGYYQQTLLSALRSFARGEDSDNFLEALLKVGHTSGHDVLAGMYYAAWKLM